MPFRAKCPACGRKQSLQDGEIGQTVWCSACGNRFIAASAPAELNAGDSSIPDIDFPASFASHAFAAAPPPPATVSASPQPPQQPIPPAPMAPTPPVFVPPEAIVPPSGKNHLVPILIGLVVVLGIALAGGLLAIVYLINRPPPAPTAPVMVPPIHPLPARSNSNASPPPSSQPASKPAAISEEPVRTTTTAPAVVQIIVPPKPGFLPVHAPANPAGDLDDQIGKSIDRGVNFLLSQFVNGKLRDAEVRGGNRPGMDALAVYALLQAGEATHDLRLGPNSTLVAKLLDELKSLSMDRDKATYSHSLRSAALSVYHRAADKQALRADAAWLISSSMNGAYTYGPPPRGANLPSRLWFSGTWDNSNSQYGALGVWAAFDAGVEVPNSYWMAVDKHWLSCQLPDGEWAYTGYGDMGRMSMTVAGITTLLVAEDQLDARTVVTTLGHPPFAPALLHGLNWLEAGNNSVRLPANWRTYALFGLERAALASGFKYFGTHDWYRELAIEQLDAQHTDGSWTGSGPIIDTSYTLLFLSRGRHPIFMNKLRFDDFWANRPRDIANLARYASSVLERPINWQVVSLKSNWSDWMDSPVLYIASQEALKFTDDDCDKLRAFAENGGLIFTHADGDSPAFNKSITELAHRLFRQYPLADLPATHPIFSTLYKIKLQPRLQGISNGSRLLLVNSPTDLNRAWQQSDWVQRPASFQMGINLFIYAAGKTNLRNKLKTPLAPDVDVTPILTASIAELKYAGNYNPEPAALPRFAKLFLADTSVKLNVIDTDPLALDGQKFLLAHLTGVDAVPYDTAQLKAIHDYVDNGGILLIDACGASPGFLSSMLLNFLPHAFPQSQPQDMPADHPILAGTGAGMTPVSLRLRPYRSELDGSTQQPIQFFTLGKGMVIFSPVDLTTGFLSTNTWGINGYEPSTVYDLVRNILLCSLEK